MTLLERLQQLSMTIAKAALTVVGASVVLAGLDSISPPLGQSKEPPKLFGDRLYMTCEDEKSVFTKIEAYKSHPTNEANKKTWNVMLSLPTGEMTINGKSAELQATKDHIEGNISSLREANSLHTRSSLRMIIWRNRFPAFRVEESPLEMEVVKRDGSWETLGYFYYEHEGFCKVIS